MPWKQIEPMKQRMEFVLRAVKSANFQELCQEFGISPKTGYKWKERFVAHGLEGLAEESRRPKSSPAGLGEAVVCQIVRLKEAHRHWGPRKIRALYARQHPEVPSESSFKRVLERAGLVQPRRLRPRRDSGGFRGTERSVQGPHELWTVDFKGAWYGAGGQRCEPLSVRDKFSRYVLELRRLANGRTETVRERFEELFQEHGLPAAIRSDNGAPFASVQGLLGLTRLSAWWIVLGIDLERGRPGCPQDNGGHERLHRDVAAELEAAKLGEDQAELDQWRQEFNFQRPHEALGMRSPAELYRPSARKYEGTPEDLSYEGMLSRRVSRVGTISWENQWIFICTALAGWSVGLEPMGGDRWKVWFGRLLLGELDSRTRSFTTVRAATGVEPARPPMGPRVATPPTATPEVGGSVGGGSTPSATALGLGDEPHANGKVKG